MPAPFVQKANSGTPSGTAITKSVTLNGQTAGNLNFVYVSYGNASGTTITQTVVSVQDDLGNPYTAAGSPGQLINASSAILVQTFYRAGIPAGNRTITATLSAATSFFIVGAAEYAVTGVNPFWSASSAQLSFTGTAVTTAVTSGNTYANATDLVIGILVSGDGMTATPGSGYTARDQIYTIFLEDMQASAAGLVNATGTSGGSHGWVAQICVFRTVSASAPIAAGEVLLNDTFTASGGTPSSLQGGNSWVFWTPGAGVNWVQVNAGAQVKLTRLRFSPVAGGEDIAIGSTLQGCNDPSFNLGPVTLFTVSSRLLTGDLINQATINASTAYQYYRWTTTSGGAGITCLDLYATWAPGCIFQPGDIQISPCTGNYDLPTYLTLSTGTSSAVIYYTVDGSTPTISSPHYSAPFVQSTSCTLQAMAASPAQNTNSRTIGRPVHISTTEVSTDIIYDSRNYRLWAMNGNTFQDPVSKYWYRYGVNSDTPTFYNYGFVGTMVYRSTDLRNWDFRGQIIQPVAGHMDTVTNNVWSIAFHILYNAANNNYVAWTDDYSVTGGTFTGLGKTVWTSPSPEGPFTKGTTFTTIGTITGSGTGGVNVQGDFSLFLDTNGVSAYLVGTMRSGNITVYNDTLVIAPLNAAYTGFTGTVQQYSWGGIGTLVNATEEAPWMLYHGGTYFLMFSDTEGFAGSSCRYITSSSPTGPFVGPAILPFQPVAGGTPDYTISYDSQVWQIITVPGRNGGYIYHGDRYDEVSNSFAALRRLRLPVVFSGANFTITWNPAWSFDQQMPPLSGAPLAPSNLSLSGTRATWVNNEPGPNKLYLDTAANVNFSQNVGSLSLPDGATTVTGVPSAAFYRVRAVNASGSSLSNTVAVGGVTPLPPSNINPPFMPISFLPGPPTALTWEDGPGLFVNPSNSGLPVHYNGQGQTGFINTANPLPPQNFSPSAADKTMSKIP